MKREKSDNQKLLEALQAAPGEYIPNLYSLNIMIHSRVSDLRRQGYNIECKKFGKKDYRYRLVPFVAVGGPVQ
jgi:hypothetical protein